MRLFGPRYLRLFAGAWTPIIHGRAAALVSTIKFVVGERARPDFRSDPPLMRLGLPLGFLQPPYKAIVRLQVVGFRRLSIASVQAQRAAHGTVRHVRPCVPRLDVAAALKSAVRLFAKCVLHLCYNGNIHIV